MSCCGQNALWKVNANHKENGNAAEGEVKRAIPDQDGCQGGAFQIQKALSEGSSRGLDSALVRSVDLEVMAVGGVQAQKAIPGRAVAWVHHCSEQLTQVLSLQSTRHQCLYCAQYTHTVHNCTLLIRVLCCSAQLRHCCAAQLSQTLGLHDSSPLKVLMALYMLGNICHSVSVSLYNVL